MDVGKPDQLAPETIVHRLGGGIVENLRLKPQEHGLMPPGISVLLGGTPMGAYQQRGLHYHGPGAFICSPRW